MIENDIMETKVIEGLEQGRAEGRAEGLATGRAEGLATGRAEGLATGRAEGRAEGKMEVARAMKANHIPADQIALFTGLSSEEIAAL